MGGIFGKASILIIFKGRQAHNELTALTRLAFDLDAASVPFNDLLTNGQTHAEAHILRSPMQAVERLENIFDLIWFNSNPIIFDDDLHQAQGRENGCLERLFRRGDLAGIDMYLWWVLWAGKL